MSGWMKYPYQECLDCDYYDPDEDEDWAIVNSPYEDCSHTTAGCPVGPSTDECNEDKTL